MLSVGTTAYMYVVGEARDLFAMCVHCIPRATQVEPKLERLGFNLVLVNEDVVLQRQIPRPLGDL